MAVILVCHARLSRVFSEINYVSSFVGDQCVTASYVLPCVLSLNRHLQDMKAQTKHCGALVNALLVSLRKRFCGIFERTGVITKTASSTSDFCDDVYFLSAILNPTFNTQWIDCDVPGLPNFKDTLRHEMHGMSFSCIK